MIDNSRFKRTLAIRKVITMCIEYDDKDSDNRQKFFNYLMGFSSDANSCKAY